MTQITTILTSYNNASTIEKAINSVLTQRDVDHELVILDNSSTDGTHEILVKYKSRLRIWIMAPCTLSQMVAAALWTIETKYVCFIGADDLWNDTWKLHKQFLYMESHPAGLCLTNGTKMLPDGRVTKVLTYIPEYTYDQILYNSTYIGLSAMIRLEVIKSNISQKQFSKFPLYDFAYMLLISKVSKICYINHKTVAYVEDQESISRTRSRLKRLKYVLKVNQVRLYFILKYGCKWETAELLVYRFIRDIASIVLKRWYK